MRGSTSRAQTRLRSGGFKCNLCGRRVIDEASLELHQKTAHNVSSKAKKAEFKHKPPVQKSKLNSSIKAKAFEDLVREEILAETKPKTKTRNEEIRVKKQEALLESAPKQKNEVAPKNGDRSTTERDGSDKKIKDSKIGKNGKRKVEFECPVCDKSFNIYFTAHKHIQNFHPINAEGKKVAPNALDLVQPIRVEECVKCSDRIRSTELHICKRSPEDSVETAMQFICSGCYESFISLKTFDLHVAGLHSDGVDSLFFPSEEEFTSWRQEMEKQTKIKYSILGEYDSKKIYRCNYAIENDLNDIATSHFCPSMIVVQDFTKGIQVHFYKKHYGHPALAYLLASKYNKYSISSFLKNPEITVNSSSPKSRAESIDLYAQFKRLMESIIVDAKQVDSGRLKALTEKALQMTALVSVDESGTTPKTNKTMSDKEITDALESEHTTRRRSMDGSNTYPTPAKRIRNKSMYTQNPNSSPKILNTFSLVDTNEETIDPLKIKVEPDANVAETPETPNKSKGFGRATRFSQSPSFNDTYKDFLDKTIKATIAVDKTPRTRDRTRINAKNVSPKTIDTPKDTSNIRMVPLPKKNNSTNNNDITDNTPKPNITPKLNKSASKSIEGSSKGDILLENSTPRNTTPLNIRKIKTEFEYEVREQENDCNILILKI